MNGFCWKPNRADSLGNSRNVCDFLQAELIDHGDSRLGEYCESDRYWARLAIFSARHSSDGREGYVSSVVELEEALSQHLEA